MYSLSKKVTLLFACIISFVVAACLLLSVYLMENNFSIHAKGSMNTFLHEMKDDFFETDTATPYQLNRFLSGCVVAY